MNFELLKIKFKTYLEGINQESGSDYKLDDSEISIFMYADEFKDYITDELNLDYTLYSEDINELLRLELVNGKLTHPDEEKEEKVEGKESELETQSNINLEDTEIITEMLNDLLQDKTFQKSIDLDGNGEINNEELTSFFNTIKGFDANEENISIDDILNATKDIQDGTFQITTTESIKESIEESKPITTGARSVSRSGGSSGSSRSQQTEPSTQEKTLDNMTKSELNTELTTAQSTLTEKQNILSSLLDGSEENLQAMNENMETLYSTYQEELKKVDEDLAEQVDSLEQSISSQEDLINLKEQEIANQEGIVSESETAYKNSVSTRQTLEDSLATLQSANSTEMDSDKRAELNSKIAELQSRISEAEQAERDAEQAWNDAQDKLETLNAEKQTLQSELDELNNQMTELEAQIAEKYPEIQKYQDAYNEAKDEYNEYKEAATTAIKSEIKTAQNYVNEINTAINNLSNKEIAKEYVLDGLTDLTRTAIELAYSQLGVYEDGGDNRGTMEKYGGGAGVPWCAAFVSWLYGKGQEGTASPLNFDASVSGLRAQAKEAGYYSEVGTYTPVPGDIMIQKSNGASHTGIVVGVDDKYIYTIEGNSGDAVRERKYEIGSGSYSKISGWIRMNEWSGGSSDIPRDTYLANNNSEDANEKERSTR